MTKALKRDSSGVSPLKENGELLTETSGKANALNRQFQLVFTSQTSKLLLQSSKKGQKYNPTNYRPVSMTCTYVPN